MTAGCYGCADEQGRPLRHGGSGLFRDLSTGYDFCAEHMAALADWEMDGRPGDDHPFHEWVEPLS